MSRTFQNAYDAYVEIQNRINARLDNLVFKSRGGMIQKHCPCCTYKLGGELPLKPSVLTSMDGNESLKRVERRKDVTLDGNLHPEKIDLPDSRRVSSHMMIDRSAVDRFEDEVRSRQNNSSRPAIRTRKDILEMIALQTTECCLFVNHYLSNPGFCTYVLTPSLLQAHATVYRDTTQKEPYLDGGRAD